MRLSTAVRFYVTRLIGGTLRICCARVIACAAGTFAILIHVSFFHPKQNVSSCRQERSALGNKNVGRLLDQRRTRFPPMIRHIKSCCPSNSRYNFLMAVHWWQLMGISISSTVNLLWSGDYLLLKSRFGNIFLPTTATSPVGT